jgi:F0F1-type ATP synthase assembly protein I
VVAGQVVITLVVAAPCYAWLNLPGATWALIGGGIGVLATLAQVLVALGSAAGRQPKEVVRAFYRGSAVKFGVTVLLFVLALRGHKVLAGPMFSGYIATFLVYWVMLARSLTPHIERTGSA